MIWGPMNSVFSYFLSNKGLGCFTAMTFNSVAKDKLEALPELSCSPNIKLEAAKQQMSVHSMEILPRTVSVTLSFTLETVL